MAFTFVKKGGAPSGAINITIGGTSYLIDDASNTTISETDATKAASLAQHPMLLSTGGTPGTYVPTRTGISQELAYSEMTASLANQVNTSALTSPLPLQVTFTVGTRPVYCHFFCPQVILTAATVLNVAFTDALLSAIGGAAIFAGVAFAEPVPLNMWKRFSTPGNYTVRVATWESGGAYSFGAGSGGAGLLPAFLRVVEV